MIVFSGHPECQNVQEWERLLIDRRDDLVYITGYADPNLSYEFDDWEIVRLDRDYFAVQATGCSCPSPTETWGVEMGPTTVDQIIERFTKGDYPGFSLPKDELSRIVAELVAEKAGF